MALARRVTSSGVAVLVAVLAAAADPLSVLASPTKALTESIERGEPLPFIDLLGLLLLLFPTFGNPIGFARGVSDLLFLALFAATAYHLEGLRPRMTFALGCVSILVAMLTLPTLEPPASSLAFYRPLVPSYKPGLSRHVLAQKRVNSPAAAYTSISSVKVY